MVEKKGKGETLALPSIGLHVVDDQGTTVKQRRNATLRMVSEGTH